MLYNDIIVLSFLYNFIIAIIHSVVVVVIVVFVVTTFLVDYRKEDMYFLKVIGMDQDSSSSSLLSSSGRIVIFLWIMFNHSTLLFDRFHVFPPSLRLLVFLWWIRGGG